MIQYIECLSESWYSGTDAYLELFFFYKVAKSGKRGDRQAG